MEFMIAFEDEAVTGFGLLADWAFGLDDFSGQGLDLMCSKSSNLLIFGGIEHKHILHPLVSTLINRLYSLGSPLPRCLKQVPIRIPIQRLEREKLFLFIFFQYIGRKQLGIIIVIDFFNSLWITHRASLKTRAMGGAVVAPIHV